MSRKSIIVNPGFVAVDNVAELTSTRLNHINPGCLAFAEDVKRHFKLVASTAVADGAVVVAAANSTYRWILQNITDADGASTVANTATDWYIDPVNGDDSLAGTTVPTALRTFRELDRRWAGASAVPFNIVVHVKSNGGMIVLPAALADGDQILIRRPVAPGYHVRVDFSELAYPLFGNPNPAGLTAGTHGITHATNAYNVIEDTNLGGGKTWANSGPVGTSLVGKRIEIVGGPRNGAWTWIVESLAGQQAKTGPFVMQADPDIAALVIVSPAAGDHYRVVDVSPCYGPDAFPDIGSVAPLVDVGAGGQVWFTKAGFYGPGALLNGDDVNCGVISGVAYLFGCNYGSAGSATKFNTYGAAEILFEACHIDGQSGFENGALFVDYSAITPDAFLGSRYGDVLIGNDTILYPAAAFSQIVTSFGTYTYTDVCVDKALVNCFEFNRQQVAAFRSAVYGTAIAANPVMNLATDVSVVVTNKAKITCTIVGPADAKAEFKGISGQKIITGGAEIPFVANALPTESQARILDDA